MLERVWRKGNPPTLLVGMQTSTATIENSVEIPLKIANRTSIWPSNPTSGHTHWGNQNWKRHMYPNVHRSTVYNSQDMETQTLNDTMDQLDLINVYKKPLDKSESGEWKSWLKAQHSENEDHDIQFHHFMANRWGNSRNSDRLYFGGLQNHCRWWLQPWN